MEVARCQVYRRAISVNRDISFGLRQADCLLSRELEVVYENRDRRNSQVYSCTCEVCMIKWTSISTNVPGSNRKEKARLTVFHRMRKAAIEMQDWCNQ